MLPTDAGSVVSQATGVVILMVANGFPRPIRRLIHQFQLTLPGHGQVDDDFGPAVGGRRLVTLAVPLFAVGADNQVPIPLRDVRLALSPSLAVGIDTLCSSISSACPAVGRPGRLVFCPGQGPCPGRNVRCQPGANFSTAS